jgi:DNA polymerase/3'-5' exonuclease PolX
MPVHNAEIAVAFGHLAALLEIEGANPFRVRAYRNARTIEDLPGSAAEIIARGEDLAELHKIAEFVDTRHLAVLDETKARLPAGLVELTNVPGIAAKRARALWLDIDDHVCCLSKDMGVKVSLGTDAHSIDGLQSMTRRGWLERRDILNTQPLQVLVKLFTRR